jgi:UDP-N-acetylglucosamine 2-epimerase (non-hydrolysing)
MKKLLFAFGTRPEAIKLAPLIREFRELHADRFQVVIAVSAQHRQMLDQVLDVFELTPDYDLDLMRPDQTLPDLSAAVITGMDRVFREVRPDLLFVQGDTLTVAFSALAAFYNRIPIAHVEAGLRTADKYSPFPEEINRRIAGVVADLHFAPTAVSQNNLLHEGVNPASVFVTGNTVIDALLWVVDRQHAAPAGFWDEWFRERFQWFPGDREFVLITGHRRESFGDGFRRITEAIGDLASQYPEYDFIYPVHLNPNVQKPVYETLGGLPNVHLLPPLDYEPFVRLLSQCRFVLSDSGGVQEEAPALGKPVLVMRDTTERPEGVDAGTARLVGTSVKAIVGSARELIDNPAAYDRMANAVNPYGVGDSSRRIADIVTDYFGESL